MYNHFCGDHVSCDHGDLGPDHPALRCEAQRIYLGTVLEGLRESMSEVLTPFGRLDINSLESCHAILRRFRAKGLKWGAVQCFLGETLGFMEWQQLQLAFWGERINWRRDLAALFDEHLGIKVTYSEEELSTMEAA